MDIRDMEYVLARVDALGVWNFYPTMEAAEADMARVNAKESPAQYAPMTWADYKAKERAVMLGDGEQQITRERYHEMLEVLPPMGWKRAGNIEWFLMSEMTSGPYTQQYAVRGHGDSATYWSKMVDVKDPSTWMK